MKTNRLHTAISLLISVSASVVLTCFPAMAQNSATITYQGRLSDDDAPAGGSYDFRFTLFDAARGNGQLSDTVAANGVPVGDGFFTVNLDFGAEVFDGSPCWLEIEVRGAGENTPLVTLAPRQLLTPAPFALHAATADSVANAVTSINGVTHEVNISTDENLSVTRIGNTLRLSSKVQQGATGPAGPKGNKGDPGARGAQGIQGLAGAKGEKGDTGN